ncbi:MAG: DUF3991 domain-containing protein [Eubacterium sp.]|nr:DUF3991 domain-containing protein [Eubacterium sp.]
MGVFIPEEEVEEAGRISLMDFLERNRPDMYSNIRRVGSQYVVLARYFGTKGPYSSFMIRASDGQWWWHSKRLHGRNALDYLMKAENYPFQQAVFELLGTSEADYANGKHNEKKLIRQKEWETRKPVTSHIEPEEPKQLTIPEKDSDTTAIRVYLEGRGIDPEVVDHFISAGSVYQGAKYKNVCFVGYDREGTPKIINQRGTFGSFKGNTKGSDRRYSFMQHVDGERSVHFFEAPVDLLSYASLLKRAGYDYRKFNLVSLSGISGTGDGQEARLPMGVEEYLDRFPDTDAVYIHFDNDEPGQSAGYSLQQALNERGIESYMQYPPRGCKDVNDYLVAVREWDSQRDKDVENSGHFVESEIG